MSNVFFRCDASPEIGFGHLMRSLALGAVAADCGSRVEFLVRKDEGAVAALRESGFPVAWLKPEQRWDPAVLMSAMKAQGDGQSWVVIDSYEVTPEYCRQIREAGARVLVIDDLAQQPCPVDVVVNPNIHAPALAYDVLPETRLLLGPAYALLRPEFLETAPRDGVRAEARTVLVTLGGSDRQNLTCRVLERIGRLPRDILSRLSVHVVLGPGYRHHQALGETLARARFAVVVHEKVLTISRLMREADLAVTAGGGTLLEAAHMGLPVLAIIAAHNQAPAATEFGRRGIAVLLGQGDWADPGAVARALGVLIRDPAGRAEMSRRGRALVDGHGPARVVQAMREIAGEVAHARGTGGSGGRG